MVNFLGSWLALPLVELNYTNAAQSCFLIVHLLINEFHLYYICPCCWVECQFNRFQRISGEHKYSRCLALSLNRQEIGKPVGARIER